MTTSNSTTSTSETPLIAQEAASVLQSKSKKPQNSMGGILCGVWIMAAILALFTAPGLRDVVERSEMFGPGSAATRAMVALVSVSDALGLKARSEQLDSVRRAIHKPHIVLESPVPVEVAQAAAQSTQLAPSFKTVPAPAAVAGKSKGAVPPETALSPKRVLLIGASSMQYALGKELEAALEKYKGIVVKRLGKAATGFSRPDAFDWPAKAKALLASFKPDLVITNFGGNDAQSMPLPKRDRAIYGTKKWNSIYSKRVAAMAKLIRGSGAQVLMLGMPIMRSPKFRKRMKQVNGLVKIAVMGAGGWYMDTWGLSADNAGEYRESIFYKGRKRLMRQADGIHLTRLGGEYLVSRLMQRIERRVRLVPGDKKLAPAARYDVKSKALGRKVSYMAYVPRGSSAVKKRPVLILLHGADGSWEDWSEHAHRDLQRLAQANQLIIVTPEGGEAGVVSGYRSNTRC